MVQAKAYQGSIDTLKKQFAELQVQLKDTTYAQVTPKVKQVIDRMVALMEKEIEPAINDAHRADQMLLNEEMEKIQNYANAVQVQQNLLRGDADQIRTWIGEHNALVIEWRTRAEAFLAARDLWTITHVNMTTTCCARDNAAVVDVAYLEPAHECDFKAPEADKCVAKTAASVKSYVDPYFVEGRNHYLELVNNCNYLTNLEEVHQEAFNRANSDCDSKETETRAKSKIIAEASAKFWSNWNTLKHGYHTNITIMETRYRRKEAQAEHDEKDRKNEWTSTQVIKCMLENYKVGGGFNQPALTACEGKTRVTNHLDLNYPKMVARLGWHLEPFVELSSYDHDDTCHEVVVQATPVCVVSPQKPIPECSNHM